jgi:hypothetical protein
VGVLVLLVGVQAMKIFLAHRPALTTPEGIATRYDQIPSSRATAIVVLAFANLAALLVVHQIIAR